MQKTAANSQAGRSQSPHPATRSPREGLLVRLDDDAPLHSEPTTIQEANSNVGSPEVNLLLPPSTGGVEAIVETVDEEGKPVAAPELPAAEQHGTPVKTPSPLGEHGDGTEDANGSESSETTKASDTKADSKDAPNTDSKDASMGNSEDVSKGDSKNASANGNGDKSNGKGHNEPKRGRNKKKGKK